jgi:hypothetical protein
MRPVFGKDKGLMRSVFGHSNDDWTGVVEVQQAEVLAVAAVAAGVTRPTEVKGDKVRMLELLVSLAHCRTNSQLPQTAGHPARDQRG